MIRYVINRILLLIPVIIAVSFIVFTLVELAPGDIADTMITGSMSQDDIAALRAKFDLDKSMFYRYGKYMINLAQGNLGQSIATGYNVFDMYMTRLPATLLLSLTALVLGVAISIPLGVLAARRAGTLTDAATTTFSLIGVSMPVFWLGLLLLLIFAFRLNWLPAGGNQYGIRGLILPGICSAMTLMATSTRQTRSSMLEVLKADFLRTARAKGAPEKIVIRKHALGNALIPIITAVGGSICVQLASSAVIENVFAWPGVGRMLVEAVIQRDAIVIMGCCIMTTILYVVVMLIVDLAYAFVDPRIKSQYTSKKRKKSAEVLPVRVGPKVSGVSVLTSAIETVTAAGVEEGSTVYSADSPVSNEAQGAHAYSASRSDPVVETYEGAQDFVTRQYDSIAVEESTEDAAVIIKKYKKRSQMGEIWHRLIHNKSSLAGLIILAFLIIVAVASLSISYQAMTKTNMQFRLVGPSRQFPFGTDTMGRNAFLRVLYGSRYSLIVGFSAVIFSTLFGVTLGSIAAYYGGKIDNIIMRFSDVLASLPGLLLGMVIMVMLGFRTENLIIAVGIAGTPHFIRMARASILTVKGNEYVEAARAVGFSDLRIIVSQVLPNGLSPIIVQVTAIIGLNIIFASSLSFLGFGIQPPTPEWGALISMGREYIRTAPWLMAFPGVAIMITVLGFNLLGDGLRDALDPKLKK